VLAIFAGTLIGLLRPLFKRRAGEAATARGELGFDLASLARPDTWLAALFVGVFCYALTTSYDWRFSARIVPQIVGSFGLVCASLQLGVLLLARSPRARTQIIDIVTDFEGLTPATVAVRGCIVFGWLLAFLVAGALVGLLPAAAIFMICYMRFAGRESWRTALLVALSLSAGAYLLFHKLLIIPWPPALIGQLLPALRNATHLF
jgi:hypothetical protein